MYFSNVTEEDDRKLRTHPHHHFCPVHNHHVRCASDTRDYPACRTARRMPCYDLEAALVETFDAI